jgi:hypothetical protein
LPQNLAATQELTYSRRHLCVARGDMYPAAGVGASRNTITEEWRQDTTRSNRTDRLEESHLRYSLSILENNNCLLDVVQENGQIQIIQMEKVAIERGFSTLFANLVLQRKEFGVYAFSCHTFIAHDMSNGTSSCC